ncbi:peptide/nickel transport system ATP-binding protein [Cognatiyoonia koreensis]|uniref:Peptide/nickel transport system ATP-binding protein n=1 Tax=Cognatiyoonia koreensis TaxID=364200 RepID=A0A1I0RRV3_9RHOB|nr:dipeptide ABC transporter ATP-binding protein [Cognatiyoonia koreensis]SEW43536.1 peptide/nickel transport system ATP-binding protein [Cognatiyoonia koreensis]
MSLLEITALDLAIHGTPVLHDVSLRVAPGEIVAITGESGSGKSMTAFATIGLLPKGSHPTGSIRLDGAEVVGAPERKLCAMRGDDVGMVFQEPMTALNPVRTIVDQVAETILVHGKGNRRTARARAAETLARVGLPNDQFPLDRYPHQLSGGQRQRVVIAMAIALRPKLLIADEPTTALDVTTQAQILALLKELVNEFGMGLLLITHDLAVVSDLADRIVVMQKGRIVEQGETRQLLADMQHPYTRALFAASTHRVQLPPRPAPAPLLEVRKVRRTYKRAGKHLFDRATPFVALNDVSFTLNRGERVGLVGESGCGKSTLTRAILGLERLQGGEILLDGQSVASPDLALRQKMQVVFQDPYGSFNPRHKVGRLVAEPFDLLGGVHDKDKSVAEALEAVGLHASDAGKYIHAFSGGQRQRIAIARALITHPELIIFDEAVSALDVSVRAQVLDLIADLCRRYPLSYLFISHDLSVVRSVTDRVLVMKSGAIVETGQTEDVFRNPRHPYTRALIAAVPTLPDLEEATS